MPTDQTSETLPAEQNSETQKPVGFFDVTNIRGCTMHVVATDDIDARRIATAAGFTDIASVSETRDGSGPATKVVTDCLALMKNYQSGGEQVDDLLDLVSDWVEAESQIPSGEFEGADGLSDVICWLFAQRDELRAANAELIKFAEAFLEWRQSQLNARVADGKLATIAAAAIAKALGK